MSNIGEAKKVSPIEFGGASKAPSFGAMLNDFVHSVDQKQKASNIAARDLMMGKTDNLVHAKILAEEAGVAWSLMLGVRGKIMESYQELMRTPV